MACKVLWSLSAERDRDGIVEYLLYELRSPQAAGRFLDELDAALETLSVAPESRALSRDAYLASLGYRPCFFMNYVALYRTDGGKVLVARIFHQSQDYAHLV